MTYFVQYPWNIFRARKFDLIKQKKLPDKFDYLFSYLLAKTSIYTLTRAIKLPLSPSDTKNLRPVMRFKTNSSELIAHFKSPKITFCGRSSDVLMTCCDGHVTRFN